jgi:hypothetical protein
VERPSIPAIGRRKSKTLPVAPAVSLVIPTLNEAANLPLVLPFIPMTWLHEVIIVDGRSTDDTVNVAKNLLPSVRIVIERKLGKGVAMQTGYRAALGDIIIVMDADGSNDPREIPRFIKLLIAGADFVKGSRFAAGGGTTDMPRVRKAGNRFFVLLVNLLFGCNFTDLCYGFHAFWRYCLDSFELDQINGFEIDTALYLQAVTEKLRITEAPSFEGYRFYGQGKLKTLPDGWKVMKTILRHWIRSSRPGKRDLQFGFRGMIPFTPPYAFHMTEQATAGSGRFMTAVNHDQISNQPLVYNPVQSVHKRLKLAQVRVEGATGSNAVVDVDATAKAVCQLCGCKNDEAKQVIRNENLRSGLAR